MNDQREICNSYCLDPRYSTIRWLYSRRNPAKNGMPNKSVVRLQSNTHLQGGLQTRGYFKRSGASYDERLVSIITVVFNGERFLEHAITSVLSQSYSNIEYIIVDGGSSDGTLDIIQKYEDAIDFWISEPDSGIYDAMNKGLGAVCDNQAYVMFLNADDTLCGNTVIEDAVVAGGGAEFIYGRVALVDPMSSNLVAVSGKEVGLSNLLYGMICHHQAILSSKSLFDDIGVFDSHYQLAADYEWVVRVFSSERIRRFIPVPLSSMRLGGASEQHYFRSLAERRQIVRKHFGYAGLTKYILYSLVFEYLRFFGKVILTRLGLLLKWRKLKLAIVRFRHLRQL